jgi:methyl-accepting chemotaxis protein
MEAKMLKNMKIGMKLAGMVIVFALLMVWIGVTGLYHLKQGNESLATVYNDRVVPLKQLKVVADMYAVNIVDTTHKVRNGNLPWDEGIKNIKEAMKSISEQWKACKSTLLTAEEKNLIAGAEPLMQKADESILKVLTHMEQKDMEKLTAYTVSELYPAIDPISAKVSALVDLQLMAAKKEYDEQVRGYKTDCVLIIGTILFGIALAGLLAYRLIRSIVVPLKHAVAVSNSLAQGDLTMTVEAGSRDEIGDLLESMRTMVENLKGMIGEVKTSAQSLASATEELSANSEQMTASITDQSGRSSQIATASEEMSQTVLDVARSASSIATSAKTTSSTAKDGSKIVTRSVSDIKAIASAVTHSAATVSSLGEKSKQIGEIIGVINDIADQTNLLALNAAIEAARAGEQGRGFAVVADEVRKLAERTAASTSEIAQMIGGIQREVDEAVNSMGQATEQVETGVKYSAQAGDSLESVVNSVDELQSMVQQIATATEEMSSTSDQVSNDIQAIATSSTEISAASGQVSRSTMELARLASDLHTLVERFRV